jgi:Cd2+/Zn2+-exporting ATPase
MKWQQENRGDRTRRRLRKACFAMGAAALLVVAFIVSSKYPEVGHMAFVAAAVVSLWPVANRCVAAIDSGVLNSVETFVTLAAVGMISIGASEEAAVLVLLFATADWLRERSADLNAQGSRNN